MTPAFSFDTLRHRVYITNICQLNLQQAQYHTHSAVTDQSQHFLSSIENTSHPFMHVMLILNVQVQVVMATAVAVVAVAAAVAVAVKVR